MTDQLMTIDQSAALTAGQAANRAAAAWAFLDFRGRKPAITSNNYGAMLNKN